jgi:hypothetical protein
MKTKYPVLGALILLSLTLHPAANARLVQKSEIQSFASNFNCSDPLLQWQFDRLVTTFDENAAAKNYAQKKGYARPIIDTEGDLRGNSSPWQYRGVTNRQFNEEQILRMVFNDNTTVSESRWMTKDLFGSSDGGDLPTQRRNFSQKPAAEKEQLFKAAYAKVQTAIDSQLSKRDGTLTEFTPHLQISGSSYNGTPVAGQFLTPHVEYASLYGEFVLFVKEVVKRGVDLERYNYHYQIRGYSIGSIYQHDRDEYFVPSHIPAWDIQAVMVRHDNSGWHRGDYGNPAYFYTKLFADKNPCETYAVRVDVPKRGDPDSRTAVGVILKCAPGATCESKWDKAVGAENERVLRSVVNSAKVNGQSLYYLPYKLYQLANPEVIAQTDLATLLRLFDNIPAKVRQDRQMWEKVILGSYSRDLQSALELATKLGILDGELKKRMSADFAAKIASGAVVPKARQVGSLMKMLESLGLTAHPGIEAMFLLGINSPSTRLEVLSTLDAASKTHPELAKVAEACQERMAQLKNLTAEEQLILMLRSPEKFGSSEGPQLLASMMNQDSKIVSRAFAKLPGTDAEKIDTFVQAISLVHAHPETYPNVDGQTVWRELQGRVNDRGARLNLKSACIDMYIAQKKKSPLLVAQKIAEMGLPEGREVDTIRSLWNLAKSSTANDANPYQFFISGLRTQVYEKLLVVAKTPLEKADIQAAFVQFYGEFISPPEKGLGVASLIAISEIMDTNEPLFFQEKDLRFKFADGTDLRYSPEEVNSLLREGLSGYHLGLLNKLMTKSDDPALAARAKKMLGLLRVEYARYIGGNFKRDMAAADLMKVFEQRARSSRADNVLSIAQGLAKIEASAPNSTQIKSAIKDLAAKSRELTALATENDAYSIAIGAIIAAEEQERLVAQIRADYHKPATSAINVDLSGETDRVRIAAANAVDFANKCRSVHELTRIAQSRGLQMEASGQTRYIANFFGGDSQRFCRRLAWELAQISIDSTDVAHWLIGERAPGVKFALAADSSPASCQQTLSMLSPTEKAGITVNGIGVISYASSGRDDAFCAEIAQNAEMAVALNSGSKYLVKGTLNGHATFTFVVGNQYELECKCRGFVRQNDVGRVLKYETEVRGKNKQWKNTNEVSQRSAFEGAGTICSMVRDQTFDRYEFAMDEAEGNRICQRPN